jgi:hypothetical protein
MNVNPAMRDLTQFEAMVDQIVVQSFPAKPPDVLYHYTTWAGAEGILSSRQFWFTAHECTNDEAELTSADAAVAAAAREVRGLVRRHAADLLDLFISDCCGAKITKIIGSVFLACFSEAKDQDSQWKTYANGGRGLCLGIRVLREETMLEDLPVARSLHRVDYSEAAWQQRVEIALRAACGVLSAFRGRNPAEARSALEIALNGMYRVRHYAAITAKRPQWAREKEWRQVAFVGRGRTVQPLERDSSGRTIRYLSLPIRESGKPLALDEIIIGRQQDPEAARRRLQGLLARTGYPSVYAEVPQITIASGG